LRPGVARSNLAPGDTNGVDDVFRRDLRSGQPDESRWGSTGQQANDHSTFSQDLAISADGRHVAFGSFASNLIPSDRNDLPGIFISESRNR
jgi:hypothetical protein